MTVSKELRDAARRNAKLIGESRWFLCLYNESMLRCWRARSTG